jgi:hypothetical protein
MQPKSEKSILSTNFTEPVTDKLSWQNKKNLDKIYPVNNLDFWLKDAYINLFVNYKNYNSEDTYYNIVDEESFSILINNLYKNNIYIYVIMVVMTLIHLQI